MTSINKKRIRISSPASQSDDVDQRNPKTHENGTNGDACRGKKLKSNTCYVCDVKDNWVLLCHGEECPVAIHQSCNSGEPDFDEFGNFYCPYCWYKRVVFKSLKLERKLMVIDKSRKGRETLGGVDLGFQVSGDIENVVEVNVSGDRRIICVNPSGNTREDDEVSYEKFRAMEKDQRLKEVAAESYSREVSESGADDVDEGRQQRGRFSEKNHETSDVCTSYAVEGRKRWVICSEKNREKGQVGSSDVAEERKQQTRCDVNHETAHTQSFEVGVKTRKQRIYSEKNEKIKRVLKPHKRGVFINDEGTQARDSDLGEGRSGQGRCHDNNQQKKASFTDSCVEEVPRTDIRVLHGSELGEARYSQGRHSKKSRHYKTVEIETQHKEVSKDRERMRERAENQDRQCLDYMRNDDATFTEQEKDFRKEEQVERNSVSSSISSPMSIDNVNGTNAASQELALIIHPLAGLQERPIKAEPIDARPYCSVSSKKPSFQPEKYGQNGHLEKNGAASNDPGQRRFVLCIDKKRKRLFWTPAEEEMLRVGVQKFPGVRNIPWRKILEFGRDVFHEERVPSDLKDKWKNMHKMSLDNGKWVSLSTERQPNH